MSRQFLKLTKLKSFVSLLALFAVSAEIAANQVNRADRAEAAQANGRFQVIGSKIYAPNGTEFIIKGTNINGPKFGWPGDTPAFANSVKDCWKFNTVRLNARLFDEGQKIYSENRTVEQSIDAYTQKGIVVMVDAHDRIGGYYEGGNLEALKGFYRNLAQKYKNNPYVWFNVTNEPGDISSNNPSNVNKWVTLHREIIKVIRNEVGADNIIIADGHYWGQDVGEWNSNPVSDSKSVILSSADKLRYFDGKTYNNIVFSIHVYDQWVFSEGKMSNFFDRALAKNIPLIVGEYGVHNGSNDTRKASEFMFKTAVPRNIGRIVWAWWGGDNNDLTSSGNGGGQHINNCQNPTNLSWLGQQVWSDNRRQERLGNIGSAGGTTSGGTAGGGSSSGGTTGGGTNGGGTTGGGTTGGGSTGGGTTGGGTTGGGSAASSATFPLIATPPTIDGQKDNLWNNVQSYAIQKTSAGANAESSTLRGAWDSQNLYLLFEVTDSSKKSDSGNTFWDDDAVQVYLDPNNSKNSTYQSDDYQFGVRWNDGRVLGSKIPGGLNVAQINTANGYQIEVRIPLNSLGISNPQEGYNLGFDVQVNDDDNGGAREKMMQLFDGTNKASQNPSVLGTVTFKLR